MKIKAIASVFKQTKQLRIWNEPNGVQWLSNCAAMYSMGGMPELTPETALRIFDIPEDECAKWDCNVGPLPEPMREAVASQQYNSTPLEPIPTTIKSGGVSFFFLKDKASGEIIPIDEKYIKPLNDSDYISFYLNKSVSGFEQVVCYDGLQIIAVILPVTIGDEAASEILEIGMFLRSQEYSGIVRKMTSFARTMPDELENSEDVCDEQERLG